MEFATESAAIVAPALTALLGGYTGVRWQSRVKVDEELRTVLDMATEELEQLSETTARVKSRFIQEGAHGTTDATRRAIGDHEVQRAKNASLRDRILIRTKPGSPIYIHYLNALLANGRELTEYRTAALMPNEQGEHFDVGQAWERVEAAAGDFERERAAYLRAVQMRLGAGRLRRMLNRTKKSDGSDSGASGTTREASSIRPRDVKALPHRASPGETRAALTR